MLRTGYKTSLIFQLYVSAAAIKQDGNEGVLVVCTSQSIIEDQIREARNKGITAASDSDVTDELRAEFQLMPGSAERVIKKQFLDVLKDNASGPAKNIAGVVLDKSHTVETWTGKSSNNPCLPLFQHFSLFVQISMELTIN